MIAATDWFIDSFRARTVHVARVRQVQRPTVVDAATHTHHVTTVSPSHVTEYMSVACQSRLGTYSIRWSGILLRKTVVYGENVVLHFGGLQRLACCASSASAEFYLFTFWHDAVLSAVCRVWHCLCSVYLSVTSRHFWIKSATFIKLVFGMRGSIGLSRSEIIKIFGISETKGTFLWDFCPNSLKRILQLTVRMRTDDGLQFISSA